MQSMTARYVALIALLGLTAPLVLYLHYDVPPPASIGPLKDAIPRSFGEWGMVDERGPSEDEKRILETEAILTRTYSRGAAVACDLSVVFAKDNRRVAHPPEICYKGSGWAIEKSEVVEVPLSDGRAFKVNRLLLLRGNLRMWVYYWYKAGPHCSANYLRMQWNIIKSHFLRRSSSSALLRVSATGTSPDHDRQTLEELGRFAAVAIPAANAAIP